MEKETTIKTVKGFDENLQCRGFQYEVGKEYSLPEGESAELCEKGFHAVDGDKSPLSVFDYYEPSICGKKSRYCEVEFFGNTKSDGNKMVGSRIKIGAEIGIPGLIKAHFEWVKRHITNENNAEEGQPATAGDSGAATAGYRGAATAGDSGAATAGNYGAATAGNYGAATSRGSVSVGANGVGCVRGEGVKARGGLGAILMIAIEKEDSYDLKEWKAVVVDGDTIKADTWYTLKDGELVELNDGKEANDED